MSLVVRVVAPTGRDARLITEALRQSGLAAEACEDLLSLLECVGDVPIGPLLIAEEALTTALIRKLQVLIENQPKWSDWPILVLTASGRETPQSHMAEHRLRPLGSPVLLERPIRTATLVSSVRAALLARQRQYEIRDALQERDNAMGELGLERERLHVMLDNLPVGVMLAQPCGEIILGNRSVERILGRRVFPTANIEAYEKWAVFHPDGRRLRGDEYPLARAMRTGQVVAPEDYLCQQSAETRIWIRQTAAPVFDEHGELAGGVVAISDIDPQKRSESALMQSEKLAAVGRLAASISHEINNPLEAVTNLLYLIEIEAQEPRLRQLTATAQEELLRVSQIVTHTLRFHRQSTNPRMITPEELLEPTLGLYRARIKDARINLELQHRNAGTVFCYEGDIRQVLNNLIGNAIDAMRTGGRLVVRTSKSNMRINGAPGVRITVADTGYGISAKSMPRIFEPFYTTKGINGTGLGLWISKGIVSKHRGRLQIRSRSESESSGTVVSLLLPAKAA